MLLGALMVSDTRLMVLFAGCYFGGSSKLAFCVIEEVLFQESSVGRKKEALGAGSFVTGDANKHS